MKRFLTTTALVAAMAIPASAEKHAMGAQMQIDEMGIKATNLIDMRLYMPGGTGSDDEWAELKGEFTDAPETWEMVGDIDDLILTKDGGIQSVLVDAGGFLGMGETERQVSMENIQIVPDADDEGEFFVVFKGDRSKFEQQESYDEARAESEETTRATANEDMVAQMKDNPNRQQQAVGWDNLTTEEVLGAAVYGSNNEWVGDLSELRLSEDGKIEAVILDVGGFLGLGEKAVEMQLDKIDIRRTGANELRAYVSATEEELENMPEWTDNDS